MTNVLIEFTITRDQYNDCLDSCEPFTDFGSRLKSVKKAFDHFL